ncbi:MAG: hypothetical protein P4L80_15820 [Xanthobacteraceae bacterium]|nr:hypothetical protein [Xanthobacteraceae bacterium]
MVLVAGCAAALTPASAWAACGGGGGGGGGNKTPASNPYDQQSYTPRKMTPADKAKLTKLQKLAERVFDSRVHDKPVPQAEMKQAQQLLDDLDTKGYDLDPDYEKAIRDIKINLYGGSGVSPALAPAAPGIFNFK